MCLLIERVIKYYFFLNLMCLAHVISQKITKNGSSVLLRGQKMGCPDFFDFFDNCPLQYTPSSMISPKNLSRGVFLSFDIALDHCDRVIHDWQKR